MQRAEQQQDHQGDRHEDVDAGRNFTSHLVTVHPGQDVTEAIISFFQFGARAVCILSATGYISRVDLRCLDAFDRTNTYEGYFPIECLSGCFGSITFDGRMWRLGGIHIRLVHPDGRVIVGGVTGSAIAASLVQVYLCTYLVDGPTIFNPGVGNPLVHEIHVPSVQDQNDPVEEICNGAPPAS